MVVLWDAGTRGDAVKRSIPFAIELLQLPKGVSLCVHFLLPPGCPTLFEVAGALSVRLMLAGHTIGDSCCSATERVHLGQ